MIREYEEYTENVTKKRLVRHTCDLCGKETQDVDWNEKTSDVQEVTIEMESGHRFYDSWDVTTTSFDICHECFMGKLVPWFESQGVQPSVETSEG